MGLNTEKCPLCGKEPNAFDVDLSNDQIHRVECRTCGGFFIDGSAAWLLQTDDLKDRDHEGWAKPFSNPFQRSRYLLSALARERYEAARGRQEEWLKIGEVDLSGKEPLHRRVARVEAGETGNLAQLICEAQRKAPINEQQKMHRVLLRAFNRRQQDGKNWFSLNLLTDWPLYFLKSDTELGSVITFLEQKHFINTKGSRTIDGEVSFELTIAGIERCEALLSDHDSPPATGLDKAEKLLEEGDTSLAGSAIRVFLEGHLRALCRARGIDVQKQNTDRYKEASALNHELYNAKAYSNNEADHKSLVAWFDVCNEAAHPECNLTPAQVRAVLLGVRDFVTRNPVDSAR